MKSFILNIAVILGLICSLYSPISEDARLAKKASGCRNSLGQVRRARPRASRCREIMRMSA